MWWQRKAKSPPQPLQRHGSKNSAPASGDLVVLQHKVEEKKVHCVEWLIGRDLQPLSSQTACSPRGQPKTKSY